jgi:hypothetical protein
LIFVELTGTWKDEYSCKGYDCHKLNEEEDRSRLASLDLLQRLSDVHTGPKREFGDENRSELI